MIFCVTGSSSSPVTSPRSPSSSATAPWFAVLLLLRRLRVLPFSDDFEFCRSSSSPTTPTTSSSIEQRRQLRLNSRYVSPSFQNMSNVDARPVNLVHDTNNTTRIRHEFSVFVFGKFVYSCLFVSDTDKTRKNSCFRVKHG
ncbi:hypothetical protein LXL04_027125 [Taraxacum kok-saghyz]